MSFPYLDPVRKANKNTVLMSPDVLRYMTNSYFKLRQAGPYTPLLFSSQAELFCQ